MYIDAYGKKWYKGNLHTHTTLSDGIKSPEDTVALYRENGYDFIALTDHWVVSADRDDRGILELAGCEYDVGRSACEGIYHIIAIGETTPDKIPRSNAQALIDAVNAAGAIAILAHPAWSLNDPSEAAKLRGIAATEIFNSVSDLPRNCRPYSGAFTDLLALRGVCLPLVAADDTHFHLGEQCRSYIMVESEELSREAICSAIKSRRFYATQGPELSVEVVSGAKGRTLVVECSPCSSIIYFNDSVWEHHRADTGEGLTRAEFRVSGGVRWLRVEVTDAAGRTAWSNYIEP